MAQEIGALYYDLNINDNNLAAQLNSTDNKVKTFGQRISGYWENSVAASGRFMLAMGVAGGAVAALGVVGVKSAADFEQSRVAFETMLGSADKARRMMQDIAKFAKETPFELPEVVAASKQLLAFGFAQEQILPTMRKLGDLAAGLGVPVGQLTNVFGQVRVAGRLMGQDLLQFTNAGVPLIEALANTMHKPQTEIKQLVEQGKVGFPEVETAINSLTGASSKFGGMMEKQSHTFNGVISNIKDGFGQALRSMIGITSAGDVIQGGLFDKLKRGAEIVMPIVQRLPELMHEGFEKIRPLIPVIAGTIMGMLIPAIVALTIDFATFLATLAPWAALGAAIGFAVNYLVQSFGGWERVTINVKNAMLDLWAAIKPIRDSLGSLWNTIETNLTPALQGLWRSLKDLYAAMQPEVISALETIGKIMGGYLLFNMKVQIEIMKIMIDVWSVLISYLLRGHTVVCKADR
jgi:tape measure domain-containing protein